MKKPQLKPRLSYVVVHTKLLASGEERTTIYGPYRSFRLAEGDAHAWEADGSKCSVEPLVKPH